MNEMSNVETMLSSTNVRRVIESLLVRGTLAEETPRKADEFKVVAAVP